MENILERFQTERTKIISKMLDNPDEMGIYPTSVCYKELDELFLSFIRHECIMFGAEYAYRKANPESRMDIPSIVYENAENYYNNRVK
jgi:hypothetical protein